MQNTQQNNIQNEIEQIKKEIDLLQDGLKNNEESLNQFQNGLIGHQRNKSKKRTKDWSFSNQRNTKYS